MKGEKEAKEYIYSGNLRRDLDNKDVSSKAIDYIIFCVDMNKHTAKKLKKIQKIIEE